MLRIPFVLLSDALLPVDVPLLQVRPDGGYLCLQWCMWRRVCGVSMWRRVASCCFAFQK